MWKGKIIYSSLTSNECFCIILIQQFTRWQNKWFSQLWARHSRVNKRVTHFIEAYSQKIYFLWTLHFINGILDISRIRKVAYTSKMVPKLCEPRLLLGMSIDKGKGWFKKKLEWRSWNDRKLCGINHRTPHWSLWKSSFLIPMWIICLKKSEALIGGQLLYKTSSFHTKSKDEHLHFCLTWKDSLSCIQTLRVHRDITGLILENTHFAMNWVSPQCSE